MILKLEIKIVLRYDIRIVTLLYKLRYIIHWLVLLIYSTI